MSGKRDIYEFGDFQLDLGEKQLRRVGGDPLTMPPKAFDLLAYLVANPGRLLEKNELMDKVWADSFVEEGNLKLHIHTLRRVLGENGNELIETVPRRGYRFNAEVTDLETRSLVIEKVTQSKLIIQETEFYRFDTGLGVVRKYWMHGLTVIAALAISAVVYFGVMRPPGENSAWPGGSPQKLAVLPLEYIGDKTAESEYLQIGLSDALVTRLANLRSIKVRPTSAVRRFNGRDLDIQAIGRELDVDSILEGTIRREADHVRVSIQLVRVSDQTVMWTDIFSESDSSLFMLEDDIALRIAHSLAGRISPQENEMLARKYTENAAAYDLYLQGRFFWNKRDITDLTKSVSLFEKAVETDPNYALAYAGLADAYLILAEYNGISRTEGIAKARNAAEKAITLDDKLAEPQTSLAYIYAFYDWNWSEADRAFQHAIELNPNYATSRQWYCEFLLSQKRYDESLYQLQVAEELDPTSLIIKTAFAGYSYLTRDFDRSMEQANRVLETDPNFPYPYVFLWLGYERKQMPTETVETILKFYEIVGFDAADLSREREAFRKSGIRAFWQYEFDRATNPKTALLYNDYQRAVQALRLGEIDQTFFYLQRSCDSRDRFFMNTAADPQWDPIRSDRRFTDLLQKAGLPV
jgi:DNA-binding winged helix-turn-helix (wHTH) protein/TolB-like protein/Tfp pilus assembly protein PilF